MKRLMLLIGGGAVAAYALMYALRVFQNASLTSVTSLLPANTVAFAHMPDFNGTRDDWHRSDIFQLYSEPAVQQFIRAPLDRLPHVGSVSNAKQQLEQLDPKDAFIALIPGSNGNGRIVAGFRFRGTQESVEQILAGHRARMGGATKRETIDYQQHKIDVYGAAQTAEPGFATAYDQDWFLASNDVDELKALLDRVDNRAPASSNQPASSLANDADFHAAFAEMPSKYALGFYLRPKELLDQIRSLRGNVAAQQSTMLEKVHGIAATTRFDNGKIHDVIYVGLPQSETNAEVARSSLSLGTADTILYAASLFDFSKQLAVVNASSAATGNGFVGGWLNKITTALARTKIEPNDWNRAFGAEMNLLADWPRTAHWPSAVATIGVKDFEEAKKLASVLAHASDEDAMWQESDRNGVHYITMQFAPGFVVLRPTIAVSKRVLVAGVDPGSVEAAIQRSENPPDGLATSEAYKTASGLVPKPTNFFAYVDLARLYTRFDETVRPILMMWAAFMPKVNDQIDLTHVPPPEVIAKHLSPIVSSQRYRANGYVTESVGPITLNQSGLALVALGALGYRSGIPSSLSGLLPAPQSAPQPASRVPQSAPTPSPALTP